MTFLDNGYPINDVMKRIRGAKRKLFSTSENVHMCNVHEDEGMISTKRWNLDHEDCSEEGNMCKSPLCAC